MMRYLWVNIWSTVFSFELNRRRKKLTNLNGQRIIKRIKRLKHIIYKEKVRELGFFRQKKRIRMMEGHLITVSIYLKQGYEEA